MQMNPTSHQTALAVALAGGCALAAAIPAAADAAVICRYSVTTKTTQVTMDQVSSGMTLTQQGTSIVFKPDGSDRPRPCVDARGTTRSTIANTDEIVVRGTGLDESFRIDQSDGAFAPGTKAETSSNREIELELTTSAGSDQVSVIGTPGNDALRVGKGGSVILNEDADADLLVDFNRDQDSFEIDGGGGDDFISARGGAPIVAGVAPADFPLTLRGGDGTDTIRDGLGRPNAATGLFGNDVIDGGLGNDTLFVDDGSPNDFVEGGGGNDHSVTDDSAVPVRVEADTFRRTEKVTYTAPVGGGPLVVGKLRLAASNDAVAGRLSRLDLGWKAPGTWRRPRQVKVSFSNGGTTVGSARINPRTGRVSSGASPVGINHAATRVAHRGETVTASLGLNVSRSLAGRDLRISVEATDRKGHRQYEPDSGLLRIAK